MLYFAGEVCTRGHIKSMIHFTVCHCVFLFKWVIACVSANPRHLNKSDKSWGLRWVLTWQSAMCCDPYNSQPPQSKTNMLCFYLKCFYLKIHCSSASRCFLWSLQKLFHFSKYIFQHTKTLFAADVFPHIFQQQPKKRLQSMNGDIFCHRAY